MPFSRFLRVMEKNGMVAIFHALRPSPVFVSKDMWGKYVSGSEQNELLNLYLQNQKLVVKEGCLEDCEAIARVREETMEGNLMSILYLVLTKSCNFRCRQCFQYERHPDIYQKKDGSMPLMSKEIAKLGIDAFVRHLDESDGEIHEPQIQFYGGEPLLNWKTLVFSVGYVKELQSRNKLPDDLRLIIVTNGSLITDDIAHYFASNGISVGLSVDGPQEENDAFRVTARGKETYGLIKKALHILKKHKISITLSVTVNPNIVDKLPSIIWWAKNEMGVESVGFNPIGGKSFAYTGATISSEEYDRLLAKGLIEAFEVARDIGIYEDRVGRKADDFVHQTFKSVDCGAVANQLVVYPNGNIGFCHASDDYNVGTVFDQNFRIFHHPKIEEWKNALPINNPDCLSCPAISICGYGCFHNIIETDGNLSDKDRQFCLHTRTVMEFLVWDLYEKARNEM